MNLEEIIINKIVQNGPVSFRDYMEMALYHPAEGYYTTGFERIGREGDFYTSPCIANFFGEMLGKQLEEMWLLLGKGNFAIVEYGAGTGIMCQDILKYLEHNQELYSKLVYYIIEKSIPMRKRQQLALKEKVVWVESLPDIPALVGCILANEVVDNFSVHRVVMQDELMEVFVDHQDNRFIELLEPASPSLRDYFRQLNIALPNNYKTEINIQATEWIKEIAQCLKKGFVLTIDYGYSAPVYYHESRNSGTLLCYYKHAITDAPYQNIGKQDITSHVNFSSLYHWGKKYGLECCGFTNQIQFLISLGLANYLRQVEGNGDLYGFAQEKQFLAQNFLLDMGKKFKVLIQRKSLPPVSLAGLRFCN